MLPTALIPIRIAPVAKSRLAHAVTGVQRAKLVTDLFGRVIDVLVEEGLRVVVLSPDEIGVPDGVEVWPDEAGTLNGSLAIAISRAGFPVLIVHADLPIVSRDDIAALLDAPGDVVIARAHDGGTNALLLRRAMRPAFGPRSTLVHARRARIAGLRASVIDRPGLALDVDDAAALTASSLLPASRRPLP